MTAKAPPRMWSLVAVVVLVAAIPTVESHGGRALDRSAFRFHPDDFGWVGSFPGAPLRLFGRDVTIRVTTRDKQEAGVTPPPLTDAQLEVLRTITPAMPKLLQTVERELLQYTAREPGFRTVVRGPHVWLRSARHHGQTWTFVVERTDNLDFGYHLEFDGTRFLSMWSGD